MTQDRAGSGVAAALDPGGPAVELCLTGNVAFSALDDVVPAPIALADVPTAIFSEAMRDIDLIVSAATVANDPAWIGKYRGRPGGTCSPRCTERRTTTAP